MFFSTTENYVTGKPLLEGEEVDYQGSSAAEMAAGDRSKGKQPTPSASVARTSPLVYVVQLSLRIQKRKQRINR